MGIDKGNKGGEDGAHLPTVCVTGDGGGGGDDSSLVLWPAMSLKPESQVSTEVADGDVVVDNEVEGTSRSCCNMSALLRRRSVGRAKIDKYGSLVIKQIKIQSTNSTI